ncbi:MAG: HD domain-containing protein [Patescibacteria group bacterium]
MKLTPRIEKAIKVASHQHRGQTRPGKFRLPYVSHLFSVAAILSEYVGDHEDVIIAGLLHDSLEDTPYSKESLEVDFGRKVLAIVEEVTEDKFTPEGRKRPWRIIKEEALVKTEKVSAEALMIKAADHTHNLENIIDDYTEYGPVIWKNFAAPLSEMLWYHRALLNILEERLDSLLVSRYRKAVEQAETELKES